MNMRTISALAVLTLAAGGTIAASTLPSNAVQIPTSVTGVYHVPPITCEDETACVLDFTGQRCAAGLLDGTPRQRHQVGAPHDGGRLRQHLCGADHLRYRGLVCAGLLLAARAGAGAVLDGSSGLRDHVGSGDADSGERCLMGMYTRLTFWADLAQDSPAAAVVQGLIDHGSAADGMPTHPFFGLPHAGALLTCSSYYHRTGQTQFAYDDIAHAWWLNVDSSLKNCADEIHQFLDWLPPYDTGSDDFRGFYLYEEDEQPTLIYRSDGAYHFGQAAPIPMGRSLTR